MSKEKLTLCALKIMIKFHIFLIRSLALSLFAQKSAVLRFVSALLTCAHKNKKIGV